MGSGLGSWLLCPSLFTLAVVGGGAEAEPSWKLGGCRLGFQGPASVLRLLPGLPAVSPGLWALLGAGWGGARWLLLKDLLSP